MSLTYPIQLTLVLIGFSISFFGFLYFRQEVQKDNTSECVFVVGRNANNCYIKGHHRKDLDIIQEFTTLKECEEYLSSYDIKDGYY